MTNVSPVASDVFDRRAAQRFVALYLRDSLPPPIDDTPEARHRRDRDAEAALSGLSPANETEAILAAQFVAAAAQAQDCLRQAHLPDTDAETYRKCTAQSVSMMRQSHTALRALWRMQSQREAREAMRVAAMAARQPKPVPVPAPVPEKPKLAVLHAPAPSRGPLPGLPTGRMSIQGSTDRMLDDLIGTAMRQNLGKRDVETTVIRASR